MTPIDQQHSDKGNGDCMRACVASILDLPMEAVPHFVKNGNAAMYHSVLKAFMYAHGWKNKDVGRHDGVLRWKPYHINGYYLASVPSANYEGVYHAVIIDREGVVVHDPSPKKQYQGRRLFDDPKSYNYFNLFHRRRDEEWKCIEASMEVK